MEETILNAYGSCLSVPFVGNAFLSLESDSIPFLLAYRFIIGFGIGAEYPAGSVAAAENTEDPGIAKSSQQKLLVFATNTMLVLDLRRVFESSTDAIILVRIDWGFVVAYLVPYICLQIFGDNPTGLEWTWRLTLGFGAIVPLIVLPFRLLMSEPKLYQDNSAQKIPVRNIPWLLIFKRYWPKLLGVSLSWFIYDWVSRFQTARSDEINLHLITDFVPCWYLLFSHC